MPSRCLDMLFMVTQRILVWKTASRDSACLRRLLKATGTLLELTSQSNCWQISMAAVFWPSSRRLFMLFAK